MKILVDQKPDLKIIVTGSSSFELSQDLSEPLTGRKRTLIDYIPSPMLNYFQYITDLKLKKN